MKLANLVRFTQCCAPFGCSQGGVGCRAGRIAPVKRHAPHSAAAADRPGVCLQWATQGSDCGGGEKRMRGRDPLVLESFDVVSLPPASIEPMPDPELAIAAVSLLASIAATSVQRCSTPTNNLVITATVPLVDPQAAVVAQARGVLQPIVSQEHRA